MWKFGVITAVIVLGLTLTARFADGFNASSQGTGSQASVTNPGQSDKDKDDDDDDNGNGNDQGQGNSQGNGNAGGQGNAGQGASENPGNAGGNGNDNSNAGGNGTTGNQGNTGDVPQDNGDENGNAGGNGNGNGSGIGGGNGNNQSDDEDEDTSGGADTGNTDEDDDAGEEARVAVCHATESESNPFRLIEVSEHAVPAHEAHGDFMAGEEIGSVEDCAEAAGTPAPSDEGGAGGSPDGTPGATPAVEEDTVILCHATSADTNPWVLIEVSVDAEDAHLAHGDFEAGDDILSGDDCAAAAPGTPIASPAA